MRSLLALAALLAITVTGPALAQMDPWGELYQQCLGADDPGIDCACMSEKSMGLDEQQVGLVLMMAKGDQEQAIAAATNLTEPQLEGLEVFFADADATCAQ